DPDDVAGLVEDWPAAHPVEGVAADLDCWERDPLRVSFGIPELLHLPRRDVKAPRVRMGASSIVPIRPVLFGRSNRKPTTLRVSPISGARVLIGRHAHDQSSGTSVHSSTFRNEMSLLVWGHLHRR